MNQLSQQHLIQIPTNFKKQFDSTLSTLKKLSQLEINALRFSLGKRIKVTSLTMSLSPHKTHFLTQS